MPGKHPSTENPTALARAVEVLRGVEHPTDRCARDLPYARVLEDAAEHLGEFEALPPGLQRTLHALHHDDEEVRTLARGALSAMLAAAFASLNRSLFRVNLWVGRVAAIGSRRDRVLAPLRRGLRTLGRQPIKWAYDSRRALRALRLRLRFARGADDLRTIVGASGIDIGEVGYRYLQHLDYVPGCEAVYHDAARNSLYTLLLGVDFIESGKALWFLEMNWNPTLADERFDLYAGEDPLVAGLLTCAEERGYRRIVAYGHRPFPVVHGRALQREAARRGIAVEIIDDYFSWRSDGHRRALVMEPDRLHDAMVLRVRGFDTVSDRAILSKQRSLEVVCRYNAVIDPARRIPVPQRVAFGAEAPQYRADARWPNVVGKVDDWDRGAGIFFYKVPRLPLELQAKLDYVEEYKVPDPVEYRLCRGQREPITGGHRASKLRCFVLVTPFATHYLSSIRVVSGLQVPETLPDGLVACKQIYLATVNEGGFYGAVDGADDTACREMATRVGEVVRGWLAEKYALTHNGSRNVDRVAAARSPIASDALAAEGGGR